MKIKSFIRLAYRNIRHRKIRSWLTMLGIFIGIAAMTTLISLGDGVNNFMKQQFMMIGADKIMVFPGSGGMLGAFIGSSSALTEKDVRTIERIGGIKSISYYTYGYIKITKKNENTQSAVMGIPTNINDDIFTQMQGYEILQGRKLKPNDKNVMLAGYRLWASDDIFDKPVRLKDKLEIEGKYFEVVGLLSKVGNRMDDSSVLIPIDTAREIFSKTDMVDGIFIQLNPGVAVSQMADIIKEKLRKERGLKKGEEDFSVQTSEQLISVMSSILILTQVVFTGIGMISLIVGGIGIMNTMYTSVLERTREIGIMKSIGAKKSDILTIFLVESGIYGLVGGMIGVITGFGIAKLIELIAVYAQGLEIFKIQFSPTLITSLLLFSFIVGAISGLLPARQASNLEPVQALRYE